MSEKHSKARKKYWSKIDPKERSRVARNAGKALWANSSKEERSERMRLLVNKRWNKNGN